VNAVMAEPPSELGSLQLMVAVLLHEATATTAIGAEGTPVGVTALLAAEYGPDPKSLYAAARKE
jgi:hypothetical protein